MAKERSQQKLQLDADGLERYALWYLERYPGSTARVRRALTRRAKRDVEDEAAVSELVGAVLDRLRKLRFLDDERFALGRARGLRQRGKSQRAIRAELRRQGIDPGVVDRMIERAIAEQGGDELEAARRLVRRKRLGPHRSPEERAARRERDLAALGRAGFDYETARRALDEAFEED